MTIQQSYPNSRPSLNLNFALSKKLDPVVTFSRTTSGTQINRSGFIESVPYDTARFDHDPVTLEPRGLLIEEGRTNFCTLSGDNYNFGATNNVTETDVFNPDGTPAIRRVPNATSNTIHGATSNADSIDISGQANGTTTTLSTSIFLRNFNNSNLGVLIGWAAVNDSAGPTYSYSLTTPNTASQYIGNPSLGSGWSNPSTKVENYGNGWYRYTATATYTKQAGYNRIAHIGEQIHSSTYQQTWTGDGVSGIYIWGRQREIGAFSTSYIPTNGAVGVRGADNAQILGNDLLKWFNSNEGTFIINHRWNTLSTFVDALFAVSTNGAGSGINLYDITSAAYGAGLEYPATNNFAKIFSPGSYKYGLTYNNSSRATVVNSGSVIEDNNAFTSLNTVNRFSIGMDRANNWHGSKTISQITYYPTRLTNAQLQALTK